MESKHKMSDGYPRQAIVTKYLGPTDFRGSRVKATCEGGALTVSWDYALNEYENHRAAASALIAKLDWDGSWAGGGTKDFYVFVRTGKV